MRLKPPFLLLLAISLWFAHSLAAADSVPKIPPDQLVDVQDVVPGVILDIRYATDDNFLKRKLYPTAKCYLRNAVARRLIRVQDLLKKQGLGLKIWDGYRPLSVQKQMWAILSDPDYVADPSYGSRHNRGAAVDVTLVDKSGHELVMPTHFDDFTPAAHVDAPCRNQTAAKNRQILQDTMQLAGFESMPTEWWHFDAPEWRGYKVLDIPFSTIESGNPELAKTQYSGEAVPLIQQNSPSH